MGFSALNEYKEGQLPECGTASPMCFCSNAMSYKPYDVSGLSGVLTEQFNKTSELFQKDREDIMKKVENLSNEWGTKFASLDGKDLGIVDVNGLKDKGIPIKDNFDSEKSKCESFISEIVSKTEEVNQYLQKLDNAYQDYMDLKKEYDGKISEYNNMVNQYNAEGSKEQPNEGVLNSLSSQMNTLELRIKELERLISNYSDIGEPDGSWVLG